MTRDLWLVCPQHFYEETDADFRISYQINQTQARTIRERLEKQFDAVLLVAHCGDHQILRLIITILRTAEFLYSQKIHTRFDPKKSDISIRFLRSKIQPI